MATITKKELIDRIAETTNHRRVQVKKVVQQFLDEIVADAPTAPALSHGFAVGLATTAREDSSLHRLWYALRAQNPKTLQPVTVPEKRTVKFKVGRLMKQRLAELTGSAIDDEASDVAEESADDDKDGSGS